jgi:hypothetical protein
VVVHILFVELDDQGLEVFQKQLFLFALLGFAFDGLDFGGEEFFVFVDHGEDSGDVGVASEDFLDFVFSCVQFVDAFNDFLSFKFGFLIFFTSMITDEAEVLQGVVVSAQNVQVAVESLDEFLTKTVVDTFGMGFNQLAQQQNRVVQRDVQLFVILLLAVLLNFILDGRVKSDDLVGQVKKDYKPVLNRFQFVRVLVPKLLLHPLHQLVNLNLQHPSP